MVRLTEVDIVYRSHVHVGLLDILPFVPEA